MQAYTRRQGKQVQVGVSEIIEDSLFWEEALGYMEDVLQMKERH
jgi:hypothetical protein